MFGEGQQIVPPPPPDTASGGVAGTSVGAAHTLGRRGTHSVGRQVAVERDGR